MKKVLAIAAIILLCGCSALSYKSAQEEVFFVSIGSSDRATGQLSKDKKITVNGQQGIDPALLLQLITALGAAQ